MNTTTNIKPIIYRLNYNGIKWQIEIKNLHVSKKWILVQNSESEEVTNVYDEKRHINKVRQFKKQSEAYQWIKDNLDADKCQEYSSDSNLLSSMWSYVKELFFGQGFNYNHNSGVVNGHL